MFEENVSQKFRLKNINEIRDYLIEERNQNELMSKKQEKVCTTLIYTEHFLVLASTITGFVFTATFASLIGIPLEITNSAITFKICATTAGIKKYKSTIKKNKKKYDKILLLAKSKLNEIELLTPKALNDSFITHDEFVLLINNSLKEYNKIKEEIKNLKTKSVLWTLLA